MIEIVLVRHAQPDWEPEGFARDEPGLTKLGRAQAECVAEYLSDEKFAGVYSSPLRRARETMEPIARRLAVEPEVSSWLAELGLPPLEGTPPEEVQAFFKRMRLRDLEHWWDGVDGGESFRHFHERVAAGIDGLLLGPHGARLHADEACRIWQVPAAEQRLLMVAHAGSVAVLLSHLLGIGPVPWAAERFPLGWAGIARIRTLEVASGAIWSLRCFNGREHLRRLDDPSG